MSSLGLILHPDLVPFAIALGIVAAMCVIELVMLQMGGSLLGAGGEAEIGGPDLDGPEFDGPDIDGPEIEADGIDGAATEAADGPAGGAAGGILGLGSVPFSLWLAGMLTSFGASGYVLQAVANGVLGTPLAGWLAVAVALVPGLALGARVARLIARIVPKQETTAISRRSYGGRIGVVTVGIARRGAPAEARFTDGHGNTHYAMVEPLKDGDEIGQGSEIAILRLRDGTLRAIRLDD